MPAISPVRDPNLQPKKIAITTMGTLEKSRATWLTPGVGIRPSAIETTPSKLPRAAIDATRASELTDIFLSKPTASAKTYS
jgi:hypothetical protein